MKNKKIPKKIGINNNLYSINGAFRKAFKYFYDKTKEYFVKKGRKAQASISFLSICDYITGHLSINGDQIDLEWYHNERDMGNFSEKTIGAVYAFCQDKVLKEGKHFITEEDF